MKLNCVNSILKYSSKPESPNFISLEKLPRIMIVYYCVGYINITIHIIFKKSKVYLNNNTFMLTVKYVNDSKG